MPSHNMKMAMLVGGLFALAGLLIWYNTYTAQQEEARRDAEGDARYAELQRRAAEYQNQTFEIQLKITNNLDGRLEVDCYYIGGLPRGSGVEDIGDTFQSNPGTREYQRTRERGAGTYEVRCAAYYASGDQYDGEKVVTFREPVGSREVDVTFTIDENERTSIRLG